MSLGKTYTLNTGAKIPAVGLGTWLSKPNEVEQAVEWALNAGYRHIYIGQSSSDPAMSSPHTETGEFALADTPIADTWAAMERFLDTRKVKAIGISNFNIRRLTELLKTAKVVPAVNQIEAHPFLQQPGLKALLEEKGIHITAYSPLGNNVYGKARVIDDEAVSRIVKETGKNTAQVLIAWAVKWGTSVIPKSVIKSRIESNFEQSELSDEAFEKLQELDRNQRYNDPVGWGFDIFEERDEAYVKAAAQKWVAENWKKE